MSKQQAFVEPQRRELGRGWVKCQPHQAQAWAAKVGVRVLGRYGAKHLAQARIASFQARMKPPARQYVLGGRMDPKPAGLGSIATSLTGDQYKELKK